MTIREYESSKKLELAAIEGEGNAFYSLIMAAMRQADTENLDKLKWAFPNVWSELQQRYHAPGGVLPHEETYSKE